MGWASSPRTRTKRRPSSPPSCTSMPQLHSQSMQAVDFHAASDALTVMRWLLAWLPVLVVRTKVELEGPRRGPLVHHMVYGVGDACGLDEEFVGTVGERAARPGHVD